MEDETKPLLDKRKCKKNLGFGIEKSKKIKEMEEAEERKEREGKLNRKWKVKVNGEIFTKILWQKWDRKWEEKGIKTLNKAQEKPGD